MMSYFHHPSMFIIYLWSLNSVEKVVLERERGGQDAISWPLPGVLYCLEGEFEQIITKIRLSVNDNNT